jgi:hypothetical protein
MLGPRSLDTVTLKLLKEAIHLVEEGKVVTKAIPQVRKFLNDC